MQQIHNLKTTILAIVLILFTGAGYAQDWKLSPLQQKTLMTYAGKDARPVVPVAMLNQEQPNGLIAAEQVATQRGEALHHYTLHPDGENALEMTPEAIQAAFEIAVNEKAVLYFEDADAQFRTLQPTGDEKALRDLFFAEIRKSGVAVLFQCTTKDTWYALAKGGCGMVSLD